MHEILTAQAIRTAEADMIASGTAGIALMNRAGQAVVACAETMLGNYGAGPIVVLCGPGNNGGDGFIAATALAGRGHTVRIGLFGTVAALKGDAATAAALWQGPVVAIDESSQFQAALLAEPPALIIDALFGIGLSRPLPEAVADLVAHLPAVPILAVDIPTGIAADTGAVLGQAVRATRTLAFSCLKPGHMLLPGRQHCGQTQIADIGVRFAGASKTADQNGPWLWRHHLPQPAADDHKYARGWTAVIAGPALATGGARLAAAAALRTGAGVVTLHGDPAAARVIAGHATGIVLRSFVSPLGLARDLADPRLKSIVFGPAAGLGMRSALILEHLIASPAALVLDADAITVLARFAPALLPALRQRRAVTVLTPHPGEFKRLFGDLTGGGRLSLAVAAARLSGCVVVLKGADSVIAGPEGQAAVNDHAPATLATLGSGDVLAGIVAGLLAQGMPGFEAAAAAVWLHGAAATAFGPGLIAEDLILELPGVLAGLLSG